MSLKAIKTKIRAIDKTHHVTRAMEAVSAVKMRKSQERALHGRPYARAALEILSRVSGSVNLIESPLLSAREVSRECFVLVTSDKGLAGNLNASVFRLLSLTLSESKLPRENVDFVCLGRKGYDFVSKRGFSTIAHFENAKDDVSVDDMRNIVDDLSQLFANGKFDRCRILYTNFTSTMKQEAVLRQLLPISFEEVTRVVSGITPERGRYADTQSLNEKRKVVYSIEPDEIEILTTLLPFLLSVQLYHSLLEAKASEHSARMVSMKKASDKAEEMGEDLTRVFNKVRQAQITREVSEITGGREVLVGT